MNNNDQRPFKDAATIFNTLENYQQALEQVNHKQTVSTRSALTRKAKKKLAVPNVVVDSLILVGMTTSIAMIIFGAVNMV
jgi:hypothetical protein